jgi:hypothetical protein
VAPLAHNFLPIILGRRWRPDAQGPHINLEQLLETKVMLGMISPNRESIGLASSGAVDIDMRKMIMKTVMKMTNMMRMILAESHAFSRLCKIAVPKGFRLPANKIKYEGDQEPEAWLDDYHTYIKGTWWYQDYRHADSIAFLEWTHKVLASDVAGGNN